MYVAFRSVQYCLCGSAWAVAVVVLLLSAMCARNQQHGLRQGWFIRVNMLDLYLWPTHYSKAVFMFYHILYSSNIPRCGGTVIEFQSLRSSAHFSSMYLCIQVSILCTAVC